MNLFFVCICLSNNWNYLQWSNIFVEVILHIYGRWYPYWKFIAETSIKSFKEITSYWIREVPRWFLNGLCLLDCANYFSFFLLGEITRNLRRSIGLKLKYVTLWQEYNDTLLISYLAMLTNCTRYTTSSYEISLSRYEKLMMPRQGLIVFAVTTKSCFLLCFGWVVLDC